MAGAVTCGVGEAVGFGCACGQTGTQRARASISPRIFLMAISTLIFGAEGDSRRNITSGTLDRNDNLLLEPQDINVANVF